MSNIINNLQDILLKHLDNVYVNFFAEIKENKFICWIKDAGVGMSEELIMM
ncbi:hypothetical protein [Flavobacterium sp.]|uniref:hypothetical protein n=1 Tax=Flavobacterium sp. TaxID=239 RepID=UPI0037A77E55